MRLAWAPLEFGLTEPFVSHKGVTARVRQVLLTLTAPDGVEGVGTAVYAREFGLTTETTEAALVASAPVMAEARPEAVEATLRALEATPGVTTNVLAALDTAMLDMLARRAGMPLHRLWGLGGLPLPPSAISLGEHPVDELLARARRLADWPILKLKMSPGTDLSVPARVRSVYGGRLWVDGNGSWDADAAIRAAERFHAAGVELLEQPVPVGAAAELRAVHLASPVPVVADEECRGPDDVVRLAGSAYAVNLKLLKCGGPTRAREAAQLARRVGLRVMLGCKTESVLGVTAMAQLAGLADHLDLDGHLDADGDPFVGIGLDRGVVTLPSTPGVGAARRSGGGR